MAGPNIKSCPEDFVVDEIPAYEAQGSGPHTFLRIEKRLRTTEEVVDDLARFFGVNRRDIGYAGRKDKVAVTRQWFSIPDLDPERANEFKVDGARILEAIRHQDAFVGALHKGLKEVGALEDTLLIILGDHGEAFGEHKIYEHDAVPYEEVIWTPVLLSGPEWLGAPRRISGLRSHLDFLPTVLEILGAQWEGRLPGRSLFSSPGHEEIFVSCWNRGDCLTMRQCVGAGS